jgi:hypothetical protein
MIDSVAKALHMYDIRLISADQVRHYSISPATPAGWEVTVEHDLAVRRREVLHDWHRVERMLAQFDREASDLVASGWRILRRVVQ